MTTESPALQALRAARLEHDVLRHGPLMSLVEAAAARGVEPADVVKTLGTGEHGQAVALEADAALAALSATVADVSDPEP